MAPVANRKEHKPKGRRSRVRPATNTKFGEWLRASGYSPIEIAEALGVGRSAVYNLRNGDFKPGRDLAVKIAVMTRDTVRPEDW